MDDIHVSRELFRAVARGELPQSFVNEITLEHLLSLCPHCRAEVQAYEAEVQAGPSIWSRALQAFSVLLDRLLDRGPREIRRAERDLQEILSLPAAERAVRIERARTRFRSPALVRLLLEASRQRIPGRPGEAQELAELARKIANRNPRMPGYFDLYALATALVANACRAGGDLQGASQAFEVVRRIMSEHGVTDLEVVARIDDLLGSLRKDQRRFAEAERLLRRAALLFGLRRAPDDAARALINLADVYWFQGNVDQGIETVRSALGLLRPGSDLLLHVAGHYNLTVYLIRSGRSEEAAELFEADQALYEQVRETWLELRLTWLRGDIAAASGDFARAEQAYLEVRSVCIGHGIGYDAAMVSLDLAILYLKEGRMADVRRVAEEMLPIFQAQDVHREALAALRLFQEAARQQELTIEKTLEVAAYLRETRTAPGVRFAWGGA
jgi:tetratricopeptide (TPR) repeat protein